MEKDKIIEEGFTEPTEEEQKQADEELRSKLEEGFEKIRTQAMLLGAKTMATTIYNMIQQFYAVPGKRSCNDMKRLIKELGKFCKTAVDKDVESPKFGGDENGQS